MLLSKGGLEASEVQEVEVDTEVAYQVDRDEVILDLQCLLTQLHHVVQQRKITDVTASGGLMSFLFGRVIS